MPFVPEKSLDPQRKNLAEFDGFSDEDRTRIASGNALTLFPRLAGDKLKIDKTALSERGTPEQL